MRRSLRLRVIMASGVILLGSIILIVLSVMKSFERAQYELIKKELAAGVNVLLTAASVQNGRLVMPGLMPDEQFNQVESEVLGVVLNQDGEVVWRSHSSLDQILYYSVSFNEATTDFIRYSGPAGEYFLYDIDVSLDGIPLTFLTMIPCTEYDSVFFDFRRNLLLSLSLIALLMIALMHYGMRWSLIPVRKIAESLKRIEQGETDQLDQTYSKELEPLADALNQLLRNERKQIEHHRNAMADLAHSLKTPLAVLQSVQLSHSMQGEHEPGDVAKVMDEQIQRMNQIIRYQLQRAVTHQHGLVKHRSDVGSLVDRITRTLDKVYHDKGVELTLRVKTEAEFSVEEQDMMEVLGNLLENAYRLCLQQVKVIIRETGGQGKRWIECQVEDDGPGVPLARRDDILKRGVRADSRTKGQGIGLAVALDIVDSYGGQLTISDSRLGGALFKVRMPL